MHWLLTWSQVFLVLPESLTLVSTLMVAGAGDCESLAEVAHRAQKYLLASNLHNSTLRCRIDVQKDCGALQGFSDESPYILHLQRVLCAVI